MPMMFGTRIKSQPMRAELDQALDVKCAPSALHGRALSQRRLPAEPSQSFCHKMADVLAVFHRS
jgi:hypothetical protein